MPSRQPTIADRRRGFLFGLFGATDDAGPPELRLARLVALEIGEPDVDLHRLVRRWTREPVSPELSSEMRGAVEWLANREPPPPDLGLPPGIGAALITIPLALRTYPSGQNVVSGAYHVARLLDPHPVGQWAAVAVSVVTACFLRGRGDFAPDLIEALRENDAPSGLLAMARRIPTGIRPEPGSGVGVEGLLEAVLEAVARRSTADPAAIGHRAPDPRAIRLAAALIGARDGMAHQTLSEDLELLLGRLETA